MQNKSGECTFIDVGTHELVGEERGTCSMLSASSVVKQIKRESRMIVNIQDTIGVVSWETSSAVFHLE